MRSSIRVCLLTIAAAVAVSAIVLLALAGGASRPAVVGAETTVPPSAISDVNCDENFAAIDVLNAILADAGLPANTDCVTRARINCQGTIDDASVLVMLHWLAEPPRQRLDCSSLFPTNSPAPTSPGETATPTPTATVTPAATPVGAHQPAGFIGPTISASPIPRVHGDVNCDLAFNAFDPLAILVYQSGIEADLGCVQGADVTCNGQIVPGAALLLLSWLAGFADAQPPVCDPLPTPSPPSG